MSDTCKRSPHLSRRPEIHTAEAPTDAVDAVDKSQLEETVELNQGIARMATVSFQRQIEVSDGVVCV